MNKKLLFLVAALPLWNACSDSASVDCNEDQKEYNGKCYNINDCVPGCDAETQRCVQGECIDKYVCKPECNSDYQKCYEGKCIGKYQCAPSCDEETEKCYRGTCYDINACIPECDSTTQKCAAGKCVDINECYPACQENEECVEGTCHDKGSDPDACYDKQCKDNTTYCDETGHWKECDAGYGCHLGYCLKGLAPECEDGACSEDGKSVCQNGTFVSCGSLEICSEGQCAVTTDSCEPGSCSADNAYRCNEDGNYRACPVGTVCVEGKCESNVDASEALLWQTCTANSDCARGICLFEVSTSRTLLKVSLGLEDAELVPISTIDSRIPEGMGICSQDCTRDSSICDNISTSRQKFSCQVVLIGDSPYPPQSSTGEVYTLPFHDKLDVSLMEIAPYASICRPNDVAEKVYKKTFCQECISSSECDASEACLHGQCLPKCSDNDQCPITFRCSMLEGMSDKYCVPDFGTCDKCLDVDNDGQGYGDCELKGFDCDDTRSDVYYKKSLSAKSCTTNFTDDNCNGHIDYAELLESRENCTTCESVCDDATSGLHYNRECVLDNNGRTLDETALFTDDDPYKFVCRLTCETGWGPIVITMLQTAAKFSSYQNLAIRMS